MDKVPTLTARMYYTLKDFIDGCNIARLDYTTKAEYTFDTGTVMKVVINSDRHSVTITLSE